jgi:hypothetical protein
VVTTLSGNSHLVRRFIDFQMMFLGNLPDHLLFCRSRPASFLSVPVFNVLFRNLKYCKTVRNAQKPKTILTDRSFCANQVSEDILIYTLYQKAPLGPAHAGKAPLGLGFGLLE